MRRIFTIFLILLLIGSFVLANKDTNRRPFTGVLESKYYDGEDYHFYLVNEKSSIDIGEVPFEVYNLCQEGETITVTHRLNQYRYLGDAE
jgi:serine protease inhibitor ecotin